MIDLRDPNTAAELTDDSVLVSHVRNIPNAVLITVEMLDDDVASTYALLRASDLAADPTDVEDFSCEDCDDPIVATDPVLYYADPVTSVIMHARHLLHD